MPLLDPTPPPRSTSPSPRYSGNRASPVTRGLTRGVCRMLAGMGYGVLTEFRLPNGRRVDVIGLGTRGDFAIVEVKSTVEDFKGDRKWPAYLPFCETFYFAVPEGFPLGILPADCGIIVADRFGGVMRRSAPVAAVNGARKRRQLVRFAHAASTRLHGLYDPQVE